jgi:hypothetical protein
MQVWGARGSCQPRTKNEAQRDLRVWVNLSSLLLILLPAGHMTKTRGGFEMPTAKIPMKFVVGGHMRTRDIQRRACLII